ncbi:MAG: hypothetical protein HY926_08520 [Elusimicrobia bacterium]|nr:hypothetical protein [Elusimicrobiota bacterium]
MIPFCRRWLLSGAVALAVCPFPVLAAEPSAFEGSPLVLPQAEPSVAGAPVPEASQPRDPDSDWELEQAAPQPGTAPSPSEPEQQQFWDRLQAKAFDDLCRNIKLPINQDIGLSDFGNLKVGVSRSLARYPDKRLALIDRVDLGVSLGYTQKVLDATAEIPFFVRVEGRAEGKAYVIRPLGAGPSCGELKRLLKVWEFKTVVPVKPERLSAMAVGEVWKLPLVLSGSVSAGVGGPAGPVNVGVSFGYSQPETASVTVYRLSESAVRLRIRIDHAKIWSGGGQVVLNVPFQQYMGLDDGGSFLEKQTDRLAWGQIRRYLEGAFGFSAYRGGGRKALIEFVLDPRQPEHMESLARFLKGDLDALFLLNRIALATARPFLQEKSKLDDLKRLEEKYSEKLGVEPAYSGADDYTRKGRRFNVQVPIILGAESTKSWDYDRIVGEEKDVELQMNQASRHRSGHFLNVPFLGQITKHDTQVTVQSFAKVDGKGFPDTPTLVFIRQEGFVRHSSRQAREMVDSVNDIMRLAGTRGQGTNERTVLPADKLFPLPPEPPAPPPGDETAPAGPPTGPTYRSVVTAFTLAFDQKALTEVLWAPADVVVRAFVNSLSGEEREHMEKALALGSVRPDGTVDYDYHKLRREIDPFPDQDRESGRKDPMQTISELARQAALLVRDLAEARSGDWGQRCRALVDVVSGKGRSGLVYDAVMKVLVQLAAPADLYGDFSVRTDKREKGETDLNARYFLNKANADSGLSEAAKLKERFAEPSLLND